MTQGGSNLHRQLLQRVRLLQKIRLKIDDLVIEYCLSGVPGDKQELRAGANLGEFFGQLAATHVRHHDVCDEQVDGSAVISG